MRSDEYQGYRVMRAQSEEGTEAAKIFFFCHEQDFKEHARAIYGDVCETLPNSDFFFLEGGIMPETEGELREYYFVDVTYADVIIFAVTKRFLSEDNFARSEMLPFAIENKLRFLPIFVECGLEEEFDTTVGSYHCISKVSSDVTEIPYKDKLRMYFDSVVPSDDLRKKVKECFKSYIFLSYRKKDRQYVRRIMEYIHEDVQYVDSAIWYDEFLLPGEDFNDSIKENFLKSDLIALIVTPNLLEEPNYVMSVEYPLALTHKKRIWPFETVATDRERLEEKYEGIKESICQLNDGSNNTGCDSDTFLNTLSNMEGEKLYYLGNAYLYGIDVERNVGRSIIFFDKALEKDYYLAGRTLSSIYEYGMDGTIDFDEAFNKYWDYFDAFGTRYTQKLESDDAYFEAALKLADLAILSSRENVIIDYLKDIYSIVYEDYKNNPGKKEILAVENTLERLSECAVVCGDEYALNYLDDWLDFIDIYENDFSDELLLNKRVKCLIANAKYELACGYYGLALNRLDEILDICRQHENEYAYYIENIRICIMYHDICIRSGAETPESAEQALKVVHDSIKQAYLDNHDIESLELLIENGLGCLNAMNSGLISEEAVKGVVDEAVTFANEYRERVNSVRSNYIGLRVWNAITYYTIAAGLRNTEALRKFVKTCSDLAEVLSDSLNIAAYGREYAFTIYLQGMLYKQEGNLKLAMVRFLKAKKQFDLTPGLRRKGEWLKEKEGVVFFDSLNIYMRICVELLNGYVYEEDWKAVKKLAKEFASYDHDVVLSSYDFDIIAYFGFVFLKTAEVCAELEQYETANEYLILGERYEEVSTQDPRRS